MRIALSPVAGAAALLALAAQVAAAQGNLSTQGFGYPPGQLSTRAIGTGGATAETDPVSPVNPASLVNWGTSSVFFQAEPEFRTVTGPRGSQRTTTARYPLTTGALALGPRLVVGVSVSTLLDRTWATTQVAPLVIGTDSVQATTSHQSEGAINDIRVGAGYAVRPWLRVGVGGHAFAGRNRLTVFSSYGDSLNYNPIGSATVVSYGGNALSAGAEARLGGQVAVSGSVRVGGGISAERNDSTVARADVPTRFGVGLSYLGIRGGAIGVRASHEGWSSLAPLGGAGFAARDAWDLGAGADLPGPRFGRNVLQLRAGMRRRTLPFEAGGEQVRENSLAFGTGTAFANGRVFGDLALTRASRETASGAVGERAWILSMGLAVRP